MVHMYTPNVDKCSLVSVGGLGRSSTECVTRDASTKQAVDGHQEEVGSEGA